MKLKEIQDELKTLRQALLEKAEIEFTQYEMLVQMERHYNDSAPAELQWLADEHDHAKAIEFCLTEHKTWMTRRSIIERLQKGGYRPEGRTAFWALNSTLDHHFKNNKLFVSKGSDAGIEALIGLKRWAEKKKDKP